MSAPRHDWVAVGRETDIPVQGARLVRTHFGDIGVFRTASGEILAVEDRCPHRGGPLSQGIVHGDTVTCPLHSWVISLRTGKAEGADEGCVRTVPVKVERGVVLLAASALGARKAA
ncbi:MAG TPA: nitrite reductase small subunit NirD [Bauldia sp.]|nr:nitrite reductase small subunit NirD [Bauldia sp.]